MKSALLAALLAAAGCGARDEAGSVSGLEGTWLLAINSDCVSGLTFQAGQYSQQFGCLAPGAATLFQDDMEGGDFVASAADITFTPRKASCRTVSHPVWRSRYMLGGDDLTLFDASGATVFQRFKDTGASTGGGGQIVAGCWSMGAFTPSPIAPL